MRITYMLGQGDFYGSERHLFELASYMNERCDIQCILLSGGMLEEKLRSANIEYFVIGDRSWLLQFSSIAKVIKEIRRFRPDIIHAHQPRATIWGMIFSRLLQIVGIATIHSNPDSHAKNHTGLKSKLVLWFHRGVRSMVALLASRTIFVSEDALGRSKCDKNAVAIYNWLSEGIGRVACRKPCRGKLRRYVCICSIVRSKGIYEMVDFFSRIVALHPEATLSVIGSGSDKDIADFLRYISDRKMCTNVSLLGYVSDIASTLDEHDAFICLTHDESFGLVFVEAMYRGLPVIASDIPILREIVCPGNFFVNLNDLKCAGFDALWSGDDFCDLRERNMKWVVDHFSYRVQMERTYDVYAAVVRG